MACRTEAKGRNVNRYSHTSELLSKIDAALSATPPVAPTGTVRPTEWYPLALRFVRATTPAYDMDLPSFERFVEKIEAIANLPGEGATAPSQEHYYSKAESAYDEGDAGRALSAPTVEGKP
jgi:hypothetical protein